MSIRILDVCCGFRGSWFDKHNKNAVYCDIRNESHQYHSDKYGDRVWDIKPDVVSDFKRLPFRNNMFNLILFDPPHLKNVGETSFLCRKYGKLSNNWRYDISAGFNECWRTLKDNGSLIFKWCELDIKLAELLSIFKIKPIFGHTTNINMNTHWITFFKNG